MQNFSCTMATAADLVTVEVEEVASVGALQPGKICTLGCYVDYLVQANITMAYLR